jgi:hypothetical protein
MDVKVSLWRCSLRRVLLFAVKYAVIGSAIAANSLDDNWDSAFGIPGSQDSVGGLLNVGSDLYAVGAFTSIGGVQASHIARFDGTNWSALAEGISSPADMTVAALVLFKGNVYAGGVFQQAGTNFVSNIAQWDGMNWFPCGLGVNGIVRSMTVAGDRLIVGGTFTAAGGVLVTNIAAWDGTNWASLGSGISGTAIDSLAATSTKDLRGWALQSGRGNKCHECRTMEWIDVVGSR